MFKSSSQINKILDKISTNYPDVSLGLQSTNPKEVLESFKQGSSFRSKLMSQGSNRPTTKSSQIQNSRRSDASRNSISPALIFDQQSSIDLGSRQVSQPNKKNKNRTNGTQSSQQQFTNPISGANIVNMSTRLPPTIEHEKYMEDFEKKLNEMNGGKVLNAGQSQIQQIQPTQNDYKKKSSQKKLKICKQFIVTGLCRKGAACTQGHSIEELDIQYLPIVWSQHFEQHKKKAVQQNNYIDGVEDPQQAAEIRLETEGRSFLNKENKIEMSSIQNRNSLMTSQLLSKKESGQIIDVNRIINQRGRSLLLEAVLQQKKEVAKELLLRGSNPCLTDWSGNDCIMYSIKKNQADILRYLLDYSQYPIDLNKQFNTNKTTYLIYATQSGHTNIIIILLSGGASPDVPDQHNRTPLIFAVKNNDMETIQALCENGASAGIIDDFRMTPVDYAFSKKQLDIVAYLVKKGGVFADQKQNRKLMFFAAENNLVDLIQELVQRNNPISEKDHQGNNLLMLFYKNRHLENIMKVIEELNLSSQICEKNNEGDCVFTLVAKEGNLNLSLQLVQKYSSIINFCIQDREGKSCLIHACEHGFDDLVEILLENGADVNSYDRNWNTPLLLAVKNNHVMCVRIILNKSPNVDILWQDQYHNTARSCSKLPAIRSLISQFMIEHDKMSDSLIKELEDEDFNLNKYFESNNSASGKKGSITDLNSTAKKNFRIKKKLPNK